MRYSKIRPLNHLCQLDLCRHAVRYGCGREDDCFYAHSLVELKVWMMQNELGKQGRRMINETWRARCPGCSEMFSVHMVFIPLCMSGITHENIVQEAKKFWSSSPLLLGNQVSKSLVFLMLIFHNQLVIFGVFL